MGRWKLLYLLDVGKEQQELLLLLLLLQRCSWPRP
jgi:hypothetical protein